MSFFVLDTDTISLAQGGHLLVRLNLTRHPPADLFTTAITIEEQMSGWYTYLRRAHSWPQIACGYQSLIDVVVFMNKFNLLSYSVSAIQRFEDLKKKKLGVRANDLRIAAIALEAGGIVVTRNLRDFRRVPGLVFEDWSV